MAKPTAMKTFDMLFWASVLVGVLGLMLSWDALIADAGADLLARGVAAVDVPGLARSTVIFGVGLGVAISVALWFLLSVLRIAFMRWVLLVFTLFSLGGVILGLSQGFDSTAITGIISIALSLASLYFLFRPEVTAWLRARSPA